MIVCAGCGSATTATKPICDLCIGIADGIPDPVCMLCEAGLKVDKWGCHLSPTGGYAGKCAALQSEETNG
jgi:hypothetical protein